MLNMVIVEISVNTEVQSVLAACWAEFLPSQAYLTADDIMKPHPRAGHQQEVLEVDSPER